MEPSFMGGVVPHGAQPRRQSSEDIMPTREGGRIVETTTEARAGQTGLGVRWMLGIGTAAVIVIFAALWLYNFA